MFTIIYYLSTILSFIGMTYYIYSEGKESNEIIVLFENRWPTPKEIFTLLSVILLLLVLSSIPIVNTILTIFTFCYFVANNQTMRTWWNTPIKK